MANPVEERLVLIETPDGPMRAFVAHPRGSDAFAAAVIVQHIGGLSDTMKESARQVAREGYLAIVPALYHRLGDIVIDPVSRDPDVAAIRAIAVQSLRPVRVMADIAATLAWLRMEPRAARGRRGMIGYGGGSALALYAAATFPEEIAAMASILGVGFIRKDDPDSPHLRINSARAELYFAFAGEDEIIPERDVQALASMLAASRHKHSIVVHPGVRHGYAFPGRPVYDASAAARDWAELRALFTRALAEREEP
jgi:carboxymethylenebutenolidase